MALGTVQLGMNYGIANRSGQPAARAATEIVNCAWTAGVRYFDTAQAYGSSEQVLGDALREAGASQMARVVTKLSPTLDPRDRESLRCSVEASRRRVGVTSFWSVMLHREAWLDHWSQGLGDALGEMVNAGWAHSVGVSVYDPDRALAALARNEVGAIQLSASVFDRRMLRFKVDQASSDRGAAVFIRSIYLQGLVAMEPLDAAHRAPFAADAVAALARFCAEHGIDRRQFAIDYIRRRWPAAILVLGAETPEQVSDNVARMAAEPVPDAVCDEWDAVWPDDDPVLVNPSLWPKAA